MQPSTILRIATAATVIGTAAAAFATATPAAAMSPAGAPVCGDGPWIGPNGIDVNGQPGFDAGDAGAAYIWHDGSGWHLRTTDVVNAPHHYTGTITVSPDATVTRLQTVRTEPNDQVWLSGRVIHYDLTTYTGVDGIDLAVSSCAGSRAHEALEFALAYDGRSQDVSRIKLGPGRQHPLFATFDVDRSV